jgi:hypothetical protein
MSMYGMREGTSAGEWVMNTVSRNPEGLLLLAAGAALLMRTGRGQRNRYPQSMSRGGRQYPGRQYSQTGKGMGERVSEAAQRAGEYVSEATDDVAGTARSYASSAMEYADEATQAAVDRSRRMAEQAQETTDYVVQEQPWAVALGGLIAGAALAAIFPATRLERRTLGEAGQRMRSVAGQMGQQLMEAGMQAGERLSEVAEERGLTAEGLKDAARDVGETFSSALSGEEERSGQGANRQRSSQGPASSTQTVPGARTTQNAQSQGAGRPQSTQPGSSRTEGPQSTKTPRPAGTSSSPNSTGGRK